MAKPSRLPILAAAALTLTTATAQQPAPARDYPHRPAPFTAVRLADGFWSARIATNRDGTIPHALQQAEDTGRIDNFRVAGGLVDGRWRGGFGFNDSDVSKILEGAAYVLHAGGSGQQELRAKLDEVIAAYAAAQEDDGYLYTLWTARDTVDDYAAVRCRPEREGRWTNIRQAHILYNAGHMYEAGVAHYRATGERSLLDVCLRHADLVCETFGPDGLQVPPGHQEIELGLVRLYRVTGERKYLDQARFFLEQRGRNLDERASSGSYNQDHAPVLEQTEAVGHAVRAGYMYAAMADVGALTGDPAYIEAIDRLWRDVAHHKLYLTGGVGVSGHGEGFGAAYELPNRTAYCETCAAIAMVLWNHRMFLLHGERRYVDALEAALYNNVLSGVSLDGSRFFYPNPLASDGGHERKAWFGCACCPSNVTRFLASVGGLFYATRDDQLFVNLYASGDAELSLPAGGTVRVEQDTGMPWNGRVALTVTSERPREFALHLRLPGWAAGDRPLPTPLYRTVAGAADGAALAVRINDAEPTTVEAQDGYLTLRRRWQPGDVVRFELPLRPLRIAASPALASHEGLLAIQRGPLVYCVEHPDVPDGRVHALSIARDAELTARHQPGLLGGVTVLEGTARRVQDTADGLSTEPVPFRAIPYYAWAHRGRGEMAVWMAGTPPHARALPRPTLTSTATASASDHRGSLAGIHDQRVPERSREKTYPFLHWWPHKGTREWLQYEFDEPATVQRSAVYWFDDTGRGQCRVPASARLLYRDGDTWRPVQLQDDGFSGTLDGWDRIEFTPVTTDALRLEVQLQQRWAAGVHEWRVR